MMMDAGQTFRVDQDLRPVEGIKGHLITRPSCRANSLDHTGDPDHDHRIARRRHIVGARQISSAYSRIVRSDENQAIDAMFLVRETAQAFGSLHRWSTSRWRFQ